MQLVHAFHPTPAEARRVDGAALIGTVLGAVDF